MSLLRFLLPFIAFLIALPTSYCQDIFVDMSKKDLLFDKELISKHKVKGAVFEVSYKYDMDIIKDSKNEVYYHFDDNGNIADRIVISPFRKRRDSVVNIYIRDEKERISVQVVHDPLYTYVDLYKYDEGKISKHENYQMKRTQQWNENIYDEKLMWSDSIHYGETYIEVYNRFGTKYKNHKIEKTSGKVTTIKSYDRRGKWEKTTELNYSGNDLISIDEKYSSNLMYPWRKEFTYNEYGLVEEKYYKEGELEYTRKISYREDGLPELDLKRNEHTGKMSIHKITYIRK